MPQNQGQGGGSVPATQMVSATGSHTLSSLNVPAGRDVTLELYGTGGGGGAAQGSGAIGGSGGSAGGYWVGVIPAALWALGGTLEIGAGGAGGAAAGDDGANGGETKLTIDSLDRVTLQGGPKGLHTGVAPIAATITVDPSVTTTAQRIGLPGSANSGQTGGAGGKGLGPGSGKGGAGGTPVSGAGGAGAVRGGGGGGGADTAGAGGAGGDGWARLTY